MGTLPPLPNLPGHPKHRTGFKNRDRPIVKVPVASRFHAPPQPAEGKRRGFSW